MDKEELYKSYNAYYYTQCVPDGAPYERNQQWLQFFDSVADHIAQEIQPKTVLDTGCALGFLVEGLRLGRIIRLAFIQSTYSVESALDQNSLSWSSDLNFGIFFFMISHIPFFLFDSCLSPK